MFLAENPGQQDSHTQAPKPYSAVVVFFIAIQDTPTKSRVCPALSSAVDLEQTLSLRRIYNPSAKPPDPGPVPPQLTVTSLRRLGFQRMF